MFYASGGGIKSGLSLLCLRDLSKCPRSMWLTVQTHMTLTENSHQYLSHFDLDFLLLVTTNIGTNIPINVFSSLQNPISTCIQRQQMAILSFLIPVRVFFRFFFMWDVFKVFIEFGPKLLLFLVFWLQGMWDLNSLTRD